MKKTKRKSHKEFIKTPVGIGNFVNGVEIPIHAIAYRFGNEKCEGNQDYYCEECDEAIMWAFVEHILLERTPNKFPLYMQEGAIVKWANPSWTLDKAKKNVMKGEMQALILTKYPQDLIDGIEESGEEEVVILIREPWQRKENKSTVFKKMRLGIGVVPKREVREIDYSHTDFDYKLNWCLPSGTFIT